MKQRWHSKWQSFSHESDQEWRVVWRFPKSHSYNCQSHAKLCVPPLSQHEATQLLHQLNYAARQKGSKRSIMIQVCLSHSTVALRPNSQTIKNRNQRQQEPVSVHRLRTGKKWFLRVRKLKDCIWLTLCYLEGDKSVAKRWKQVSGLVIVCSQHWKRHHHIACKHLWCQPTA